MKKFLHNVLRIVALLSSIVAMSEIDSSTIVPNICWLVVFIWALIISEFYLSE